MFRIKLTTVTLVIVLIIFVLISKAVFDKVHLTLHIVVDEEFHLPLGRAYCKFEFDKWHPKVTTFPGLYLLSSLLFGAFDLCSTYWLRLTSLIFSVVNLVLFYWLLSVNNESPPWQNIISSLNLALLPPLYFFSHVYYTDVPSLTMILILFLLSQRGNHYLASIFGLLAVLFRQTNIIWVGMVFACYVLQEIIIIHQKKTKTSNKGVSAKELGDLLKTVKRDLWSITQQTKLSFWLNASCYASFTKSSHSLLQYFSTSIYARRQ
ncbi:hypothetical protein Zmor_002658 [Zophobas morio]|uniref:Dol-P-Glc:Glc(2)Man(9)GlcNAc(2)-PP-Dol alpha-1,2-glucosyltransferase n=1 Tax=Zophobas morio TaxID=2755281 RepID=A0AA38M0F6_9CUCU|nr:hypothetical protein Zmor_002658 [Zophobas morio]